MELTFRETRENAMDRKSNVLGKFGYEQDDGVSPTDGGIIGGQS